MRFKFQIPVGLLLFTASLLTWEVNAETSDYSNKPVVTQLNSKWPDTPLLMEAAEYMAEEAPATFWNFVHHIVSLDESIYSKKLDSEKYEDLLSTSRKILSDDQIRLLELSLSLRTYSPKLEMFRQIALDRGLKKESETKECNVAVEINNEFTCSLKDVKKLIEEVSSDATKPTIYDIDHRYPGGEDNKVGVILYGEMGKVGFGEFHHLLVELVTEGKIDYILRPYVSEPSSGRARLSGYGVELAIKSTEYKAQDDTKVEDEEGKDSVHDSDEDHTEGFYFSKLKQMHPDLSSQLNEFKQQLVQSTHDMAPMKVWQLQHLSMQAAQRVLSQTSPLDKLSTLIHTSNDFPMLARGLIRTKVEDKMKKEILKNQNYLRSHHDINPKDAALYINGMYFDMDYTDMFTLLDHVKNEQRAMEGLHQLGLKGPVLDKLLSMDSSSNDKSSMGGMGQSTPDYGLDIRDTAIIWLNDIENDSAYKKWPASVTELLRPGYPGMLRSIRKNLHNLVLVVDPLSPFTVDIFKHVDTFLMHNIPVRIGVVFKMSDDKSVTGLDDAGVAMLCAFNYVVQSYDGEVANKKGFQFLLDLYAAVGVSSLSVETVTGYFKGKYKSEDIEDVFGSDSDFDVGRRVASEFIGKGGFKSFPQALSNGVPLNAKHLLGEEFEETVLMEVMRNTQLFQRAVYRGELRENQDVVDYLMAAPNIMPRLNERILNNKNSKFLDMSGVSEDTVISLSSSDRSIKEVLDGLALRDITSVLDNTCHYISTKVNPALRPLTLWILGDFDTYAGRDLLLEAIKYTRESDSVRVCGIHAASPESKSDKATVQLSKIIQIAQSTLPSPVARQFLVKVLEPQTAGEIIKGTKTLDQITLKGYDSEAFIARLKALKEDVFSLYEVFTSKVVGVPSGTRLVLANGRLIGPFDSDESFAMEDFALLEKFAASSITDKITELLKDYSSDLNSLSTMLMKVSGVIQTKPQTKARTELNLKGTEHSTFTLPARDSDKPMFNIVAICDPVSLAAQKMSSVLQVLHQALNAEVMVVMNAVEKHSEMPLKSFYRLVLEANPRFNSDTGKRLSGPYAIFSGLPASPILTQNLHVPENWLVEVVKSKYDLDNIKLENVESAVTSEFELENLLIEGHCFEQSTGNPPRGLQITLGTQKNPVMVDTTVMANLGYFQLKGNPGAWLLLLREGRSRDIYDIASHEGTDTPVNSDITQVLVSSFRSHVVKLRVAKKPGMEAEELLEGSGGDAGGGGGLWNTITSTFGSSEEDSSITDNAGDTINIFSVASGHLYERFLRIMMLSVRKQTSSPVKFWFLKNFLSPMLKDSLPILAQEYGFSYELVQYKWPRWLHQQTEKQRIIWGYKILFLDVLFPLDVKKIIFVDADQVVRADLKELYNLDLEGAPYGFVPFCDSRKEMEGFRFWKSGYWRNHLGGRKYHISALFVVDLKRFRRIAAGDRLRGQYQGLSQDPNSLSNLDQDLPNNMIHQVRIKSLPMEWLWCETWCDDQSKDSAKVIDVCNNPQTKEAKLEAANRIIDEWSDYDEDIKRTLAKYKQNKGTSESAQQGESTKQSDSAQQSDSDQKSDSDQQSDGSKHSEL